MLFFKMMITLPISLSSFLNGSRSQCNVDMSPHVIHALCQDGEWLDMKALQVNLSLKHQSETGILTCQLYVTGTVWYAGLDLMDEHVHIVSHTPFQFIPLGQLPMHAGILYEFYADSQVDIYPLLFTILRDQVLAHTHPIKQSA